MKRLLALLLGIAAVLSCVAPTTPERVGVAHQAITPTCIALPDVADGMVRNDTPTSVNGIAPSVTASYVLTNGVPVIRHAMLRFDLSGIPAGATISTVSMSLWGNLNPSGYANIHTSNSPYSESTTNWNNAGTYGATVAMAAGTGAIPAISLPPSSLTANGYTLEVESTGTLGNQLTIASREDSNAAHRPSLTVCYTPAPTCSDGVQNGSETGIDCGGSCPACPTCSDGIQNQGETGIDCGGPCAACPTPDAGSGGSDAGADAGDSGVDAGPGGEAITPLSTCGTFVPDNTVAHASYAYGTDPAQVLDLWTPNGTAPPGGWPVVVNVHGGGFVGGQSLAACPNGDPYALGCIQCGAAPGRPDPCNPVIAPNVVVQLQGRQALALQYYARVLGNGPAHLMPDGVTPMGSVVTVNLGYRLMAGNYPSTYNAYPAAVNDAQSAQAWLVANATTLGINPGRIGWVGYSAGGHLAAKVTGIQRRALWYANLYFDTPSEWSAYNPSGYNYIGCAVNDTACVATHAPPVDAVPAIGDPPVLLSHSLLDTTVLPISSQRYYAAAQALGVPSTLMTFTDPNGAPWHGYGPTVGGWARPSNCTLQAFWQGL